MKNLSQKSVVGKTMVIVLVLGILAIVSMIIAWQLAVGEEERENLNWQNRVSVVLNGRAAVVANWVNDQKDVVSSLAENASVRLYYSNLNNDMGLSEEGDEALQAYLLPLLNDRASQNGFIASVEQPDFEIRANVERPKYSGLALTNSEGQILVSTASMPSVIEAISSYIQAGSNLETILVGPYAGESGLPSISTISPVFGVDDGSSSPVRGFVVGVKVLDQEFFALLDQPGESQESAKNFLVRQQGDLVHYIQNRNITDPQYQSALNINSPSLAAGFAITSPGTLKSSLDFSGSEVLASGTKVAGTDWTLIRTIDEEEALGPAKSRKRNILIIATLIVVSTGILMGFIWRYAISVRLEQAIKAQKELTKKHENLSKFMSVVTNSQQSEISAVDDEGNYTFVNLQTALAAGSKPEDMLGKTPAAVFGHAKVGADELNCREVLASNNSKTEVRKIGTDEFALTVKTDYLPLILGDESANDEKGVLIVKEDITALERNRIKRELSLKSLVSTLTMIIGSRDPYSATHSERVVEVTNMLCAELNVDDTNAATAELAGAMMNLGKILVPRELLVKPSNLTEDELTIIRSSMLKSADLIKDIEFEGPVSETLTQMQAHWDGSGQPQGLAGDDILLSARLVSVANAFVGMTSARAHREGMDMSEAVKILMDDADKVFDRRPVVALMNYLENKGGKEKWSHFGNPPITVA